MSYIEEWQSISSDPSFRQQPDGVRSQVMNNFFDQHIASNVPKEELDAARQSFMEHGSPAAEPQAAEVKAPSMLDKIGSYAMNAFSPKSILTGDSPVLSPVPGVAPSAVLDFIAEKGRAVNNKAQEAAASMAEAHGTPGAIAGTVLGTASEYLTPKNRLGAAMLPLQLMGPAEAIAGKAPGMIAKLFPGAEAKVAEEAASAIPGNVKIPSFMRKPGGILAAQGEEALARSSALEKATDPIEKAQKTTDMLYRELNAQKKAIEEYSDSLGVDPMANPKTLSRMKKHIGGIQKQIDDLDVYLKTAKKTEGVGGVPEAAREEVSAAEKAVMDARMAKAQRSAPKAAQEQAPQAETAKAAPAKEYQEPGLLAKTGGQLARVATGTPEAHGTAALNDLQLLGRSKSPAQMSKDYEKFEEANKLTGLQKHMEKNWQDFSANELKQKALDAARKIQAGEEVTKQELYIASQAARKVSAQAASRDPDSMAAMSSGLVEKAKKVIDPVLEKLAPGHSKLRTENFESKVGESFGSLLPLNKNRSANALRGALAIGGALTGHPAGLAVQSPAAWGGAIRAAGKVQKGASATAAELANNPALKKAIMSAASGAVNATSGDSTEEMNLARLQSIAAQQRKK